MQDQDKTKKQLIDELSALRRRITKLETLEPRHKETEKALAESRELFQLITETMSDMISVADLEGKISYYSGSHKTISGYHTGDRIGKSVYDFVHPEDDERSRLSYSQCVNTGAPQKGEFRFKRANGQYAWLETQVDLIRDKEGRAKSVILCARDITRRKQMEEALQKAHAELEQRVVERTSQLSQEIEVRRRAERRLRESERKYRTLVTHSLQGIVIAQGLPPHLVFANPAIDKILGYTPAELTSLSLEETQGLIHTEDRPLFFERFMDRMKGKLVPSHYEVRGIRKDGSICFLEIYASKIKYMGKPSVLATFMDISERKQAEERLRLLSSAVDQSTEGIGIVDLQGKLLFVNNGFAEMHGYRPEEIANQHLSIFHTPEQMAVVEATNRQVRETGKFSGEVWHARKDGSVFPALMQNSLLRNHEGNPIGMIGTLRDFTEQKRIEEKIKASLEEKEILLREIFHRVKNNIQVISSLILLQSKYFKNKKDLKMLEEVQSRISAMALVQEKLYRSKDLAYIDLKEYVRELVEALLLSYGTKRNQIGITIKGQGITLPPESAISCGLIIHELVSNSLKHAFPKGTRPGNKLDITFRRKSEKELELILHDNGVGLPGGLDFRNTKTLGFQLVHTLVRQLQGTIRQQKSKGTTFKLVFQEKGVQHDAKSNDIGS
jgi:PAS domain S-box-containing protein